MFPFAFGVPLASQQNSPAVVVKTSPNAVRSSPNVPQPSSQVDGPSGETYAEKKANWKSSLRRPHPFLSREPDGGYRFSRTLSSSSRTGLIKDTKDVTVQRARPVITVRSMLMLAVIVLSTILLIIGLIYADTLSGKGVDPASGGAGSSIAAGNTTSPGETKPETELLLARDLTKSLDGRQDPTPVGQPAEAANSNQGPISELMKGLPLKGGKHSSAVLASLFFYVAALPLVSIIHAAFDLVLFYIYTRMCNRHSSRSTSVSSISDDDSFCESDHEDIDEEKFKHKLAYPALPVSPEIKAPLPDRPVPKARFQRLGPIIPLLSLITTVIVVEGWAIVNGIQVHCELVPSGHGSKVCPSLLHPKGAISIPKLRNMSIARTTLSWMIVLLYLAQIVVTLKQNKIFSLRRFAAPKTTDAEASANTVSSAGSSPPRSGSILSRGRSRSNSARRKTVRFDLEEAARRQSERGEDVQYIPAPSDGYDNGYGLAYNYSANYAYPKDGAGGDVRTPWQWQGQFEEFVHRNNMNNGNNTNAVVAATLGTGLNRTPIDQQSGGSFDFGLASMRRMVQEQNLVLAKRSGFIANSLQVPVDRNSPATNVNPSPSTMVPIGFKPNMDEQSRPLTSSGPISGVSAIVPFALATTGVPLRPKITSIRKAVPPPSAISQRSDTIVSAMTNGRTSIDLSTINEEERKMISPMEH